MVRSAILGLLVLLPADAFGYSPARARRLDVESPNKAFVLDVDPWAGRGTVYESAERGAPLWSFPLPTWTGQFFVADDGQTVAFVLWLIDGTLALPDGVCVEFWAPSGRIRQYTTAELCPHPDIVWWPHGGEHRGKVWYTEAHSDGTSIRVRTTDEFEYVFAPEDGRIVRTTRIAMPWWVWRILMALTLLGCIVAAVRLRRWLTRPAALP